ncbi:MAG: ChaN family lipoprotein [Desulfobacterales bacterium]|jgi:uncharacterized iron-regulated protein
MKKIPQLFLLLSLAVFMLSCAGSPKMLSIKDSERSFAAGTILDTRSRSPVSFDALVKDLATVQVVYVGESHTDAAHHRIQLQILEALDRPDRPLSVGMEMFDTTYDSVLSRWSAGDLEPKAFIQMTHWYVNWGYDFALYREILEAVQRRNLPLFGLNIPFHIPPKIAAGGMDSLLWPDNTFLPDEVDLTDPRHRAYLEKIYALHRMPENSSFEFFYEAQCVWEDAMAQAVAAHLQARPMLVLVGKGHIVGKFGIPDRAFRRTREPFLTVMLVRAGETVDWGDADYVWVTQP